MYYNEKNNEPRARINKNNKNYAWCPEVAKQRNGCFFQGKRLCTRVLYLNNVKIKLIPQNDGLLTCMGMTAAMPANMFFF